jgi:hypothetical protein
VTGRRRRRTDRGSATAELAVGLPAVVLLLLAGLTAVAGVTTRLECVDAAREAVLAAARGQSGTEAGLRAAPDGAQVTVTSDGDLVHATVRAPVPLLGARLPALAVEAAAVAAAEPGSPEPAP